MANNDQSAASAHHTKKVMKKVVADKLQTALPDMKTTLGEKKFSRRLKKAVKMLLHGVHNSDVLKKAKQKADTNKAESRKNLTAKQAKATKKVKKVKVATPEMF